MERIDIYRGADLFYTIELDDNCTQQEGIMQIETLNLQFPLSMQVAFRLGDWCTVFGKRYIVNTLPVVKKQGSNLYDYTMQIQSEAAELTKVQYLFLGADNTLRETDFALMGNPADFLNLLVANMNRVQSGWQAGAVPSQEYKNLTFSKETVWNALVRIAEAFNTEFWIENKAIHLGRKEKQTGHTYRQGMNQGLRELTRVNSDDSSVITRLFAYGSEQNLPNDYRGFSRRLRMFGVDDYIEQNTDVNGVVEGVHIFDNIYPERTGIVTGVNALDPFEFSDSTMDFDINAQQLPTLTPKVSFITGQLTGYNFNITSYNVATKRFRIAKNTSETKLDAPSDLFRPQVGDKYVLVDLLMPQSYITAAEQRLLALANEMLTRISAPQIKIQAVSDPKYLKLRKRTLNAGDVVYIEDTPLGISRSIRITAITRNLVHEWSYDLTLADAVNSAVAGKIDRIVQATAATGRDVSTLGRDLNNNATLNGYAFLPTTPGGTGFAEVMVEIATGRLFRKE
jgi:hypothetical protein